MTGSRPRSVEAFIQDVRSVNPDQAEILVSIELLFFKANKELSEEIKYGGLVFLRAGELIGGIFPYKKHISIEFSYGADFSDPSVLLEGSGKRRRHLKIQDPEDLESKNAKFFIEQAAHVANAP